MRFYIRTRAPSSIPFRSGSEGKEPFYKKSIFPPGAAPCGVSSVPIWLPAGQSVNRRRIYRVPTLARCLFGLYPLKHTHKHTLLFPFLYVLAQYFAIRADRDSSGENLICRQ